ncbi:Carboxylesterase 2 [Pleomorphomonas sp. T1.2MG-36]|uniref:alpha/beta hydrolase n=1 Tax=Pleomorphomonas sp. T1.2MG-36 TaxID=3041167 RepID=UPI002477487C|nr:prolyl oligopeptidase family serine peptidase [Pleomorphomonas sp. T1.2MG-36]CAI9413966.1 Carboxylesterase 2 [Pleomorphomonas sp. T1.2MG-36]
MTEIDGPRLEPASGKADALVVLLHGYGANGEDLYDIAESWAPFLPDAAFVSPHAPQACPMVPGGRQWFPLTMRDDAERWSGVLAAGPALDHFLDTELERWGVLADRLVLVGFSQGTMMALHVGLRRKLAPALIVGYSGYLAGADHLDEISAKPKVLLVHGTADQVLPVDSSRTAAAALTAAGLPVSLHLSPGLGHGIDRMGLVLGLRTIAEALGVDLPSGAR